jgi:hypothetical protein
MRVSEVMPPSVQLASAAALRDISQTQAVPWA